jgi:hypothetical protein
MPEILTESFCERCGTRYTFESAAPKQKRLGRFKVLSQGFRNFVMSDDTSLDEAFAAARNDEEREAVTQQLDAFHKTFNFCMNCRQYTCSNCWNEVEGRCLTCAPHLGHDVLPAPFPTLETNGNGAGADEGPRLDGLAWPTLDLPPEATSTAADLAWPETTEAIDIPAPGPTMRVDGLPDWASLVPDEGPSGPAEPELVTPTEPPDLESLLAHPALALDEGRAADEAQAADEARATHEVQAADEAQAAEAPAEETAAQATDATEVARAAEETEDAEAAHAAASVAPEAEAVVAEAPEPVDAGGAEPVAPESTPSTVDERVAAAAAQTAQLLARFRPGQSIDAALEEYEASLVAQDAEPEALAEAETQVEAEVATQAEALSQVEAPVEVAAPTGVEAPAEVAAAHETPLDTEPSTPLDEVLAEEPPLEAEIAAAIAETEPEPAQAEPVAAIEAAPVAPTPPEPEPAQPEPAPRAPVDDRVEVPVWRIVAPDTPAPAADGSPDETSLPTAASAEPPQWPQTPAWPGQEPQVDVSFLAARLSRKPANDALWAASARDVLAPMPQQPAPPAVQTCVTCGLSLSATARFCRRCGSRQGG